MNYKDKFGVEIKTRDVVAHSNGYKSSGITTSFVKGFTPKMIKVWSGTVNPSECIVVTEQYIKNIGKDKYNQLIAGMEFDDSKPKSPKKLVKHRLEVYRDGYVSEKYALVYLSSESPVGIAEIQADLGYEILKPPMSIIRHRGTKLEGDGKLRGGYYGADKERNIPARLVKRICGSLPLESCVIVNFDTAAEMNHWLQANHVHGEVF